MHQHDKTVYTNVFIRTDLYSRTEYKNDKYKRFDDNKVVYKKKFENFYVL